MPIVIKEELTKYKQNLLKIVYNNFSNKMAWSNKDSNIIVFQENKRCITRNEDDISKVCDSEAVTSVRGGF